MTSAADKAGGGAADPGVSLLTRIGDFVEPLTRFDRGHLTLLGSDQVRVEVAVRQEFKAMLAATPSHGVGQLPAGVIRVEDAAALKRATEIQLATARAAAPSRLAAWAEQHGDDPRSRPTVADCFTEVPPVGHVDSCPACNGRGQVNCRTCGGEREMVCSACSGSGQYPCKRCGATGGVRCNHCFGLGYRLVDRQESLVDPATGSTQHRTVQAREPCASCRNGQVTCEACGGRAAIACAACRGSRRVPCSTCSGSGLEACQACEGTGTHFHLVRLSCAVSEALDISPRTQESDIAGTLKSLGAIDDLLAYAESYRASAEAGPDTLRRDTVISAPVTTVVIAAGARQARVRGYGPGQDVRDYGNVAGLLLSDDLDALEAALPFTRAFPPKTTSEMESALSGVLASEVNVSIAGHSQKEGLGEAVAQLRGVVSAAYVARAAPAIRKALSRAYWSAMMRGPVAALAIPVLEIPVELLVRSQGAASRTMAMAGVMLLAFGGGLVAHMLAVRLVQKRIRPDGVPRISAIIGKTGVTLRWLVAAAASAIVLTLAMAGVANALFPALSASPS